MSVSWVYWPSDPTWTDDSSYFWETRPPWVRPSRPGTMRWGLRRTADPSTNPISLNFAKSHLRVDITDDDSYINSLILAASEYIERRVGIAMMPSTWQLVIDRWPRVNAIEFWPWPGIPTGSIMFPRWPVSSVTSLVWTGADASVNTVAPGDYIFDNASRPALITPAYTKSWPAQALIPRGGIVTTFQAGYATAAQVPPSLLQAILLMIGHWYENRESVALDNRLIAVTPPHAVDALISSWQNILVG